VWTSSRSAHSINCQGYGQVSTQVVECSVCATGLYEMADTQQLMHLPLHSSCSCTHYLHMPWPPAIQSQAPGGAQSGRTHTAVGQPAGVTATANHCEQLRGGRHRHAKCLHANHTSWWSPCWQRCKFTVKTFCPPESSAASLVGGSEHGQRRDPHCNGLLHRCWTPLTLHTVSM
jgi:hypothetical protein